MSFSLAPTVADSNVVSFPKAIRWMPHQSIPTHHIFSIQPHLFGEIKADLFIFGEIQADLFIIQPLQVNIEQDEDGTYIVSDDLFLVYGNGDNKSDAMGDYTISLVEFYQLIEKNAAVNPFDQKLLANLQFYIKPKPLKGFDAIQTDRD